MEKNTLSNYGWIIICVLVLSVMLAFASPFGKYVGEGIVSIVNGFRTAGDASIDEANIESMGQEWEDILNDSTNNNENKEEDLGNSSIEAKMNYYNSLNSAVNDVNSQTIGQNTNADRANATACVYTAEDDQINIVLLKNTTESQKIIISQPATLNLNGKTLEFFLSDDHKIGLDIAEKVTIDGTTTGSSIICNTTGSSARMIQGRPNCELIINGGTYNIKSTTATNRLEAIAGGAKMTISNITAKSTATNAITLTIGPTASSTATITNSNIESNNENGNCYTLVNSGITTVSNCNISANNTNNYCAAVVNNENSTLEINDCQISSKTIGTSYVNGIALYGETNINNSDIIAISAEGSSCGISAYENSSAQIIKSNIKALANYTYDTESNAYYKTTSVGISNSADKGMYINDCYVYGTHSGISTNKKIYIDGGTYEGYGHGGIYFCGDNVVSYVKNASIKDAEKPEGYIATSADNNSGFYVGGGQGNDNIIVYIDNCDIYGPSKAFCLRGTSGEQNNTVYISNSRIDTNLIRIDNNTHKLYVGEGMDISQTTFYSRDDADITQSIIITNENYSFEYNNN